MEDLIRLLGLGVKELVGEWLRVTSKEKDTMKKLMAVMMLLTLAVPASAVAQDNASASKKNKVTVTATKKGKTSKVKATYTRKSKSSSTKMSGSVDNKGNTEVSGEVSISF